MNKSQSGLDIKMNVVVTSKNICWFDLKIENVRVFYSDPTDSSYSLHTGLTTIYSEALARHAAWVRITNGNVNCIWWHDNEELWVRNFKRGIFSAVNDDKNETDYWETGVIGTCRVKRTVTQSNEELTVYKEYDTSSCYNRPKQIQSTVALNPHQNPIGSQFYNMPMRAWHQGKMVPGFGLMWTSIDVEAIHQVTPFGQDGGSLAAQVRQSIQFISVTKNVAEPKQPSQTCQCSSILYEFPDTQDQDVCDQTTLESVKAMIGFLASNFKQPNQIRYAKEFLELVGLMRKTCSPHLRQLWTSYQDNADIRMTQKEIFLDALPAVCTDASVKVLTNHVMPSDFVSLRRLHRILMDMHFCSKTTKPMVRHYMNYVTEMNEDVCVNCANLEDFEEQDLKVERWLLLSTLIRQHGCQEESSVKSLKILESKLQTHLDRWNELVHLDPRNDQNEQEMDCLERDITVLIEALGNTRCLHSLDTLIRIFKSKSWTLSAEMQTAAIRGTKLMMGVASGKIWSFTLEICSNEKNPTEVRIAAWDTMMEMTATMVPVPYESMFAVVMGLQDEKNTHYASYVWSWLMDWADNYEVNNRRATYCQLLLRQTGAIYWGRKFNLGYLSSKFNVMSWSPWNSNQLRVVVKSRVVFDEDSTMPHSAAVELDLHLLGQTIPVFMLEGHMEGANWMVEHLFGPAGYFATGNTYNFTCGLKHTIKLLMEPFPKNDLNINIHLSMFGREFRHWSRSLCWFEEYMRTSPLYSLTNALWWVLHDTDGNLTDPCPYTIESPIWHKETGMTWANAVDVFQRAREMVTVWKMFYDGTIWERALNTDVTSVLVETNITIPTISGLPVFFGGNVIAHMSLESSGSVQLPQNARSDLWPQAVWNHLYNIWNIWTNPRKVQWQADINPRMSMESSFAMGFDAHYGGCSMEVEMSAESNQVFQFKGTMEPDDYTVTYKIPQSDSGVTNLASYKSEFNFKHWDLTETVRTPIVSDIPLEKKVNCIPKVLTGVELCVQYGYYNSADTWAPYYPLNGPSYGNILLSTADQPCNNCGYEHDSCCIYNVPPTKIMGRVLKTNSDDFTIFLEGFGSSPMRKILVNYRRDRNYPTDTMSYKFWWNTCEGPQYVEPVAQAKLSFRWDRVDLHGSVMGKARTWEMESFSWMNRTWIESDTTYVSYERDTQNVCNWKKPEDPYRILIHGSLSKRKEGQMRVEVEDPFHVKHWWQGSTTSHHLMTDISMTSSLFNGQQWNFGVPLPHPIDTASCHVFGDSVITFDRLPYAVRLSGSYILARSISSDNFTVILHSQGLSKPKELEIWLAGTKFQLTSMGLTVNSAEEMIPYRSCLVNVTEWNATVDESYIRFTSRIGLEIYYNPNAIELSVNGFYFKRMKGLCGNNNNDGSKSDEWQKSDGEVSAMVTDFADSWQISGVPTKALTYQHWTQTAIQTCGDAFSRESMVPLHQEIDMDSFKRACIVEVLNSGVTVREGVCRAIDGVKVASFSRDFALPAVCWYGPWTNWMVDSNNKDTEYREREPIPSSCDTSCRTEREYRSTGDQVYECEPWISQKIVKTAGLSKKCLSLETFQTCSSQCKTLVEKPILTNFRCSSSFELLHEAPVITMGHRPAVKCICSAPCWSLWEETVQVTN
jgi:hypothetical protein